MFINPDKLNDRLEKGKIETPPRPINELNHSGDRRGKNPAPWLNGNRTGRGNSPEVPESIRATVGALARISGIESTANSFDLHRNVVQFAKRGQVTGNDDKNEALEERIDDILRPVRDKALDRLMKSLDCLTDEKIGSCKAREIAGIASSLSNVMKNIALPTNEKTQGNQVVIYAPSQKPETEFDTIEVNA